MPDAAPQQLRRRRDEPKVDSMPWWYAGVAVALVVFMSRQSDTKVAMAGVVALCLFFAPAHDMYRPRRADRAHVMGCLLLHAVTGVLMLRSMNPVAAGAIYVASLVWICTAIGFFHTASALCRSQYKWLKDFGNWCHEKREEHEFELARDVAVPAIFRHVNHPNAGHRRSMAKRLVARTWTTRGWQYAINVLPWTAEQFAEHDKDIAAFLGIRRDQVVTKRSQHEEGVALTGLYFIDTLTSIDWTPVPSTTVTEPLAFGHSAEGDAVEMTFVDMHWMIGGTTGSGKSMLLHQVCAKAVASTDALLVILDAAKGGRDYKVWRPHSWLWADDLDQCRTALQFLERFVDSRYRDDDGEGSWVPTTSGPQIIIVADEGSDLNDDPKCKEALKHLVRKSRGAGVSFVFGVQRPHNQVFDTNILTNINGRVMLRVDTQAAVTMMLPGFKFDPHTLPLGGYFLARWPGLAAPVYGRSWYMQPGAVRGFAESHRSTNLGPPMGRPRSLIPAIGSAIPGEQSQVGGVSEIGSATASDDLTDVKALSMLRTLVEVGSALNQTELVRLSDELGNPRTVAAKGALLAELGYATAITPTTWMATDAGRARMEQEVTA